MLSNLRSISSRTRGEYLNTITILPGRDIKSVIERMRRREIGRDEGMKDKREGYWEETHIQGEKVCEG